MFLIYHPRATYVNRMARDLRVASHWPNHDRPNKLRRNHMSVVVNWGCSRLPVTTVPMLNREIGYSVRKIRTFAVLNDAQLPTPRIVTDPRAIVDGAPFYMRGKYLGRIDGLQGGAGITVYERGTLPLEGTKTDFYSQVVAKATEVRIHVAGPSIICEQIKHVPAGSAVLIRNWDNGARFSARSIDSTVGAESATRAREIAIAATRACGLDFGALDMALTRNGNWVIFEINSAPGLSQRDDDGIEHDMPSTYEAYREYFRSFVEL